MDACTEPVRTGVGAVCVECGRPKWPITMMNHTHILSEKAEKTPYAPRMTRYEMPVFAWKTKKKKASSFVLRALKQMFM